MATELLYLRDAYLRTFTARVTDARDSAVAVDRTAFYPTGGGQPHDTGTLAGLPVVEVRKGEGDVVWHTLGGDGQRPAVDDEVEGSVDWSRRHALMRTHSALHVLCGVIWNEWGKAVTGGNMEELAARTPSPPFHHRWRRTSTKTAPGWRASGVCGGPRWRPTSSPGRNTSRTVPTAATTAKPS